MKNRIYIAMLLLPFIGANAFAQIMVKPAVADQLLPARTAQMKGYVGEKLQASYEHRIMAQDVDRLVAPFKDRSETSCWQSEFWGKWITSSIMAYKYDPQPKLKAVLDKAVTGLLATQTPDGYIGNYTDKAQFEQWDIWGRKYCMLGLLSYYDLTGDKKTLQATRKLADHLIKQLADKNVQIVKKGNHRGMAATSVLEPICLLYTRTGDKRYLAFAVEVVNQWESAEGPQLIGKAGVDVGKRFAKPKSWFGWEQGQKAYEMMSCYEGLLELHRITGKPAYRDAVERTWQNIKDTEINIAGSGSAVECWFGGKELQALGIEHYQETCVTATWIKLSQQLLRLTGEVKYADAIERSYYNALLGAMSPDGSDWAKYSPLAGERLQGGEQCHMGLNCCVASGPRGLFTLPLTAVMGNKQGISINFYVDGNYQLQTPAERQAEVIQQTDFPASGDITVSLKLQKAEQMSVSIRIPAWSKQSTLTVNGEAIAVNAGEYATITRLWRTGDLITLALDMRGRSERVGAAPQHLAITRGPIVLSRDTRLGGPDVDATIVPVTDKEGIVALEPIAANGNGFWMRYNAMFKVESHKEGGNKPIAIPLCDYASAGNTFNERSWFRVWLPQPFDPRQ